MLYDQAHQLAQAIRASEEWQEYHRLREEALADETTAALVKEYKKLQTSLQMAAMAGGQGDQEDQQRFAGISALLFSKSEAAAYLLSELRLQQAMADIFKILTDAADLDLGLPTPE